MSHFIVGLTGGIGSGKSEVSRRFTAKGITVIDADIVAREVVVPDSPGLLEIVRHFGPDILLQDGTLNRAALRELIFTHPHEKSWLESLLHPLINLSIRDQLNRAQSDYAILASPLLFETKQSELVARVLVIDAPESIQVSRACLRDGVKEEQIRKIIANQISRNERCNLANDIIQNHGDLSSLDEQIYNLHTLYLKLAQN